MKYTFVCTNLESDEIYTLLGEGKTLTQATYNALGACDGTKYDVNQFYVVAAFKGQHVNIATDGYRIPLKG